jgi:hypothetical protein
LDKELLEENTTLKIQIQQLKSEKIKNIFEKELEK